MALHLVRQGAGSSWRIAHAWSRELSSRGVKSASLSFRYITSLVKCICRAQATGNLRLLRVLLLFFASTVIQGLPDVRKSHDTDEGCANVYLAALQPFLRLSSPKERTPISSAWPRSRGQRQAQFALDSPRRLDDGPVAPHSLGLSSILPEHCSVAVFLAVDRSHARKCGPASRHRCLTRSPYRYIKKPTSELPSSIPSLTTITRAFQAHLLATLSSAAGPPNLLTSIHFARAAPHLSSLCCCVSFRTTGSQSGQPCISSV